MERKSWKEIPNYQELITYFGNLYPLLKVVMVERGSKALSLPQRGIQVLDLHKLSMLFVAYFLRSSDWSNAKVQFNGFAGRAYEENSQAYNDWSKCRIMHALHGSSLGALAFESKDVAPVGAAFIIHLGLHEIGHQAVVEAIGIDSPQMNFFTRNKGRFYLGLSTYKDISA
jgi:hypothetical protein